MASSPIPGFPLDELLAPVPGSCPAGRALRDEEDLQIQAALRSHDGGGGVWLENAVEPNWLRVLELTGKAIASTTKSLQLAAWYTEAATHACCLPGMSQGFRLIAGLIERYWDTGLMPNVDNDSTYRARPIESLNSKICSLLVQFPLTQRSDPGDNYGYFQYQQAVKAGLEAQTRDKHGNLDTARKKLRDEIVEAGGIVREVWDSAVKATPTSFYAGLSLQLADARESLVGLVRLMDDARFFGPEEAPSLSEIRRLLDDMQSDLAPILKERSPAETPKAQANASQETAAPNPGIETRSAAPPPAIMADGSSGSWEQAESLIRSGRVEEGLEKMAQLASQGHGRSRFLRKLSLAEACAGTDRDAIATLILEELAEQIRTLNLAAWESPELIARVWGLLHRHYVKAGDESRASELFLNLCRLDPWQGIHWMSK